MGQFRAWAACVEGRHLPKKASRKLRLARLADDLLFESRLVEPAETSHIEGDRVSAARANQFRFCRFLSGWRFLRIRRGGRRFFCAWGHLAHRAFGK